MVSVARKNMFRDRGRLALTALGVAAAAILIHFGLGMANGTLVGMLLLPARTGAGVWVLGSDASDLVNASVLPTGTTSHDSRRNSDGAMPWRGTGPAL